MLGRRVEAAGPGAGPNLAQWSVTVSRPGGRGPGRKTAPGRGRSGLRRAGCWLTASRGDPQDSATENRPPMARSRNGAGTGKGETVPQERTSGRGDPAGSVNPTRSKAKRGTWAARPPASNVGSPQVGRIDGWPPVPPGTTESRLQAGSPSLPRLASPRLASPSPARRHRLVLPSPPPLGVSAPRSTGLGTQVLDAPRPTAHHQCAGATPWRSVEH